MTKGDEGAADLLAMQSAWRALVIRWDVTWGESSDLLPAGREYDVFPPEDSVARMRLLIEIDNRLRRDDDDELRDWLRRPQLMFGFATPLEVMSGTMVELTRVRELVDRGFGS